jgi:hypothetical protein
MFNASMPLVNFSVSVVGLKVGLHLLEESGLVAFEST